MTVPAQLRSAAHALCDICRESGNELPTLIHLQRRHGGVPECSATHVWTSDVDVFARIVREADSRKVGEKSETIARFGAIRPARLSQIDAARILELLEIAGHAHAGNADLREKMRAHLLYDELVRDMGA